MTWSRSELGAIGVANHFLRCAGLGRVTCPFTDSIRSGWDGVAGSSGVPRMGRPMRMVTADRVEGVVVATLESTTLDATRLVGASMATRWVLAPVERWPGLRGVPSDV